MRGVKQYLNRINFDIASLQILKIAKLNILWATYHDYVPLIMKQIYNKSKCHQFYVRKFSWHFTENSNSLKECQRKVVNHASMRERMLICEAQKLLWNIPRPPVYRLMEIRRIKPFASLIYSNERIAWRLSRIYVCLYIFW